MQSIFTYFRLFYKINICYALLFTFIQSVLLSNEHDDYFDIRQKIYYINLKKVSNYKNLNDINLDKFIKLIKIENKENLNDLILRQKDVIIDALNTSGGVLIRGAQDCELTFSNIFPLLFGKNFEFSTGKGDNTPRTCIAPMIYNASEVPKEFYLHQHNEDTFLKNFPQVIAFYCASPPLDGEGATPLTKNHEVLADLPPYIIEEIKDSDLRFTRYIPSKNNLKVREINRVFKLIFKTQFDMIPTLEKVFNTEDKESIQDFLVSYFGLNLANLRDYIRWDMEGNLEFSTEGEKMHPPLANIIRAAQEESEKQDDNSWCKELINQCRFDVSQEFEKAASLSGSFSSSLSKDELTIITNSLLQNTYRFQWRKGDLLILNNEKILHGREPFSKEGRRILVSKGSYNLN